MPKPIAPPVRLPSEKESDEELLRRLAAGDRAALDELYRRHMLQVHRWIFTIIRVDAIAEELAQDTFVHVGEVCGRFDPSLGSAAKWLRTVACNGARNELRRIKHLAIASEIESPDHLPDAANHNVPSQRRSLMVKLSPIIHGYINGLSEPRRERLRLYLISGLSCGQIATAHRVSNSAVSQSLTPCIKELSREICRAFGGEIEQDCIEKWLEHLNEQGGLNALAPSRSGTDGGDDG